MEKICAVANCGRSDINAREMCNMHYGRYRRHGDPMGGGRRAIVGPAEALMMHSIERGACRIWTGADTGNGYGVMSISGKTVLAHRMAFELAHGSIMDGLVIDHICHIRACINPDHLRAVTQKQNLENNGVPNRRNKSGVRGVFWSSTANKWAAQVCHNYKKMHVGLFDSVAEAESAVIAKRNELFTHNDLDRIPA